MSKFAIYRKDGSILRESKTAHNSDGAQVFAEKVEYNGSWMGECFLTVTVRSAYPIDFHVGDYVDYRGERFTINYDPSVVKKARRGTHGEGFVYDSIKFNARHTELTDIRFLDYVLYDNGLHFTSLPEFPFYAASIDDYCDRLQANTNRWCSDNGMSAADYWQFLTYNRTRTIQRLHTTGIAESQAAMLWDSIYAGGTYTDDEKTDVSVSVSGESIWDSLTRIKNDFGLNFINRDRKVIVGMAGLPTNEIFVYGKDNGLYELERNADTEQQIVTKLFAYGSEKNMPVRYYAAINMQCFGYMYSRDSLQNNEIHLNVQWSSSYMSGTVGSDGKYDITITIDGTSYSVKAGGMGVGSRTLFTIYSVNDNLANVNPVGKKIYVTSGIVQGKWSGQTENSNLPNNMAVSRLMLPGFPLKSLYQWVIDNGGTAVTDTANNDKYGRATWTYNNTTYDAFFSKEQYKPYILSLNFKELGMREASKVFDGSDGSEEIYPTIEGTGYDVIASAEVVSDNGVFSEGDDEPTVTITLPNFGNDFDLIALANEGTQDGGTPTISMKSGYCGARQFSFDSGNITHKSNGTWEVKCKREHDDLLDLWFPYSYAVSQGGNASANEAYQVRGADVSGYDGDNYVLTGIPMSSTYINVNAVKLLAFSLEFLAKNDYTRYTYLPKVDEIFMARQHDDAIANQTRSLYLTLKEGDLLRFSDSDLNISTSQIFIDTLHIKENGNADIPTYEVTLRNDKQVGTIQRIQNKIDSIIGGVATGTIGGVNRQETVDIVSSEGNKRFLSKVNDDTAQGLIGFVKGLWVKAKNLFGIDANGNATLNNINANGDVTSDNLHSNGYSDDTLAGSGYHVYKDANSEGHVCTDYLDVRKKARFTELEIRRLSYINAENVQSMAASKVVAVLPVGQNGSVLEGEYSDSDVWAWRCLVLEDDGTTATTNGWQVGDQARCQSFNIKSGVYQNVSNRYYWRLVIRIGDNYEYGEKTYYWFELAATRGSNPAFTYNDNTTLYAQLKARYEQLYPNATDGATHVFAGWEDDDDLDNPAAEDTIVQMGSQTDETRMGFFVTKADGLNTGPYIYAGVNNFSLVGKMITKITPQEVLISARKLQVFSDPNAGDASPLTHYRGDWTQGSTSYYYDEWDYQGSRWLCLYQGAEGTTEAPGTTAANWKEISLKGDAGTGYKLLPNPNIIKTKQTGENTYDPATASLTCGYVKNVGGTITSVANATVLIDNKYAIYFRRKSRGGDYESKYWFYTDSKARAFLSSLSLSGYDATEFYLAGNSLTPSFDIVTRATFLNSLSGVIDNIIVPVVADGSDGTDGTSPIIADLTNEMDSVVCDAGDDTAYGGQVCTTIASMLEGTTRKAFTLVEVKEWNEEDEEYVAVNVSGGTIAGDVTIEWSDNADNSKTVTFTFASAVSINGRREFVIVMRTGNVVREAVFTIAGLRPGADGSPATIYNILPSLDKITFARDANGGLTPSSRLLSFMVRKAVGGNITDILSGQMYSSDKLRLTYSVSEPPSSYNSNQLWPVSSAKEDTDANISFNAYGTATIPNSVAFSSLYLALFKEITNGNSTSYTLLDRETIPVIKDGQDGDDGKPGADAWTLTVNPSPIIIEQNIEDGSFPFSSSSPMYIDMTAKCGDNAATVGTPTSLSNNLGLTMATVNSGNHRLKITAYGKTGNPLKYVTQGIITCSVQLTYGSRRTTMSVQTPVGVNLLGTWTQEIKDGVETSVSENIGHAIDPSGNIETTQQIGTYIRGWAENTAKLTETIGARSNGNNLFGFSKGAIFDGSIPFVQGYGMACVWNNNQAYSRVWNLDFGGKTGYYVVTCEIKAQSAANIRFFLADIAPVSGSGLTKVGDELKVAATTQWKKITAVYNLTAVDAANSNGQLVIRDGSTSNNVFIRKLQIEHGSVPSDFGVCKEDEMAASVPVSIDWSVPSAFTKASSGGPDGGECYYNNTHPASGSHIEINAFNISLPYGVYTMSFWAKANVDEYTIQCICGDVNDYDTNVMPDLISGEYGVMESYQESGMNKYGSVNIKLSTQWRKYYVPYYLASAGNMYIVPMRINYGYTGGSSGTFYISKIKFDKGYVTSANRTEYQTVVRQTARNIDFSVLVNSMEKAGIHLYTSNKTTPESEDEIDEGVIDLVAGKVNFKSSNGAVNPYMSIDQNGKLIVDSITATNGDFSGTIHATSGDFTDLTSQDEHVAIVGSPTQSYDSWQSKDIFWRGLAIGEDPVSGTNDLATIGGRFDAADKVTGYGYIALARNRVVNNVATGSEVTVNLRAHDGEIYCKKINAEIVKTTTATTNNTSYQADGTVSKILCNRSGNQTVTLPANLGLEQIEVWVRKTGTGTVTVKDVGSSSIGTVTESDGWKLFVYVSGTGWC